jgi:hypothetical protein
MAVTAKAKSAATTVVVTPKVAKITKSDIANAILAQSDEVKVGLMNVAVVNSENLNKFTKDALVEIVKVANPKFEVLKKTTKGEIIPVIMKAEEKVLPNLAKVILTEDNLMKLTKDVLEGIIATAGELIAELAPTEETPAAETTSTEETPAETATEEATPTDAVITDESVEEIAPAAETEATEATEA